MYIITPYDLETITDVDLAFGTTKLLPKMGDIPEDFEERGVDLLYFQIVNSLFYGLPLPEGNVEFIEGFEPGDRVLRAIRAHLASWQPKHEDKMLGVAYMLKCMCVITPKQGNIT